MDDRFAQQDQRLYQIAVAIGCLAEKAGITPADIDAWMKAKLAAQPVTSGYAHHVYADKDEPVETPQEDSIGE